MRAVLYMGTVAATRGDPVVRRSSARLRATGKPQKVALVACLHQLLTILHAITRDQAPWRAPAAA